jgi:ubiquitin-conjugating enzyme E2 D/E
MESSDMHLWKVCLLGPVGTPYQGGKFYVKIDFPLQYPFKPPHFTFLTKVYHPSVQQDSGEICTDMVNEGWGPTLNVQHCLTVIYSMLRNPEADDPLDEAIAQQLRDKPKEFEKMAKKYTKEYAK